MSGKRSRRTPFEGNLEEFEVVEVIGRRMQKVVNPQNPKAGKVCIF